MTKKASPSEPKQAIKRATARAAPTPAKTGAKGGTAPSKSVFASEKQMQPRGSGPCIVGIGASAGGFEPLRDLLRAVPADSGMAFVVVQHLDPTYKSLAVEILARHTRMTVLQVEQGMRVAPNCVYTVPSDRYLALVGGVFHLTQQKQSRGLRLPIDYFFDSLGTDQHERAIGIILSGAGSDGAVGLKSIAENDGIVIVQDPRTAQFDSMPLAAIATGLVNKVSSVSKMPALLAGYARHPYATGSTRFSSSGDALVVREIIELLLEGHGYDFGGYKQGTLLRRVKRRMGLLHIQDLRKYGALLRKDEKEREALYKDLLIGVTQFFRDREAWKALDEQVVRALVKSKKPDEPIRVWAEGVATGEEAYSLAMILLERVRAANKHCPIQILATDSNEDALHFARAGIYPAGITAHIAPALLRHYFSADGDHHYRVSQALRECVIFGRHNLYSDPPFSKIDLVSCRNLLIYLEPEMQKRAILLFHFALRPSGYLFLGSAETVGQRSDLFKALSKTWRIYRDTGATARDALDVRWFPTEQRNGETTDATGPKTPRGANLAALAQQIILDQFAPAAVLVNDKCETVHFCGATERYLVQPRGFPTRDLLALLRDGLRSHVRSAIRRVQESTTNVSVSGASVKRGSVFEPVRLTVAPAGPATDKCQLFLVVFEDLPKAAIAGRSRREKDPPLVKQLEEELRASKQDLQDTIEHLETANEELRVSNEEVISSNEELQAVNEELMSSKEELQSINEELNAVNLELNAKVAQIEDANNDLLNLLASSDIATVCLDREERIRWFSPAASTMFNILDGDIGRPISDLASLQRNRRLTVDARAALKKLQPVQAEIETEDHRTYIRRTLPFRIKNDEVDGVIVTFTDITEALRKGKQQKVDATLIASLEQRVRKRTGQLRALMFDLAVTEERERRAIAVDLHDDLGQLLAVINIKLVDIVDQLDDAELAHRLEGARQIVLQADKSIRSLAFQISPPVLSELGLVPAVEWLAEEIQRVHGLRVDVRDDGQAKPLDQAARSIVFRCVRELLINVAKHAKVDAAGVELGCDGGRLRVSVADSGVGFKTEQIDGQVEYAGFGLLSVRERIGFIGGTLDVRSTPHQGAIITLTAPLLQEQALEQKQLKRKHKQK